MIFFGVNLRSSARQTNIPEGNVQSLVHYKITIHPDWMILQNACPMMVTLSDGVHGFIGQPQIYIQGKNTYHFYEMGPASGMRVAELTDAEVDKPKDVCYVISITDTKSGTFFNGGNYMFDLYGTGKNINPWGKSNEKD